MVDECTGIETLRGLGRRDGIFAKAFCFDFVRDAIGSTGVRLGFGLACCCLALMAKQVRWATGSISPLELALVKNWGVVWLAVIVLVAVVM